MASNINPLYPVAGTPTTQSVRDNFLAAKTEIEALQTAVGTGGSGGLQPLNINDQSGTSYTIQESDINNMLVRMAVPNNQMGNIVIPTDANLNAPIGSSLMVSSNGIGVVNITGESGVLIRSPQSKTIDRKYGRIVIIKTGPNEWEIDGQLVNQLQYFVTPYTASQQLTHVSLANDYMDPATQMNWTLSFYGISEMYSSLTFNNPLSSSSGVAWNSTAPNDSIRFGTAEPVDLYFRMVFVSGPITPTMVVQHPSNQYESHYYGFGEWGQYKTPTAATNWGRENPRWTSIGLTMADAYAVGSGNPMWTVRIDISELPSDSAIIGSCTWTINAPFEKHLQLPFSNKNTYLIERLGKDNIGDIAAVFPDGKIASGQYSGEVAARWLTSNMVSPTPGFVDGTGAINDWASVNYGTTMFTLSLVDVLPDGVTYTGSMLLDQLYTMENIVYNNITIAIDGPTDSEVVFSLNILTSLTGSVTSLGSDTFTMKLRSLCPIVIPVGPSHSNEVTGDSTSTTTFDLHNQFYPTGTGPEILYFFEDGSYPWPSEFSLDSSTGIVTGNNVPVGTYTLHAYAVSSQGASGNSATVIVNITQ